MRAGPIPRGLELGHEGAFFGCARALTYLTGPDNVPQAYRQLIQVAATPGQGWMNLTGEATDFMVAAARAALRWIKVQAEVLGPALRLDVKKLGAEFDVHFHLPPLGLVSGEAHIASDSSLRSCLSSRAGRCTPR
jgi:hypothetical protein